MTQHDSPLATGRIRAILSDVEPAHLGTTYAHEHLALRSALIRAAFPHILLDDVDRGVIEVTACEQAGVRTMVDAMPCAAGRDVTRLAEISRRTGVQVIAVTGLHHRRYYGPGHWTEQLGAATLAQLFVDDLVHGIDAFDYTGPLTRRTGYRAGAIKVASSGGALDARDRLLFEAAAHAHHTTGAPILTHCERGKGGLEQIDAFERLGVQPDALLLSHVDKLHEDVAYHEELARRGAWLVYDQALRTRDQEPSPTARLIAHQAEHGHLGRLLVGTDGARRDLWTTYDGSPGLAWLAKSFPSHLRAVGLSDEDIARLFVQNPGAALTWRPTSESGTATT